MQKTLQVVSKMEFVARAFIAGVETQQYNLSFMVSTLHNFPIISYLNLLALVKSSVIQKHGLNFNKRYSVLSDSSYITIVLRNTESYLA